MSGKPCLTTLALALLITAGCSPPAADARQDAADTPAYALSDPQIAHVAVTANAIDVEMARLVDPRTTTAAVRAFAQTMITDHTAVNERAAELAQRLGVTPEDNPVSRSLRESADAARENLSGLRGEEFDRAYLAREVEYHQAVLGALDDVLIPGAANADLRALLQEVRPAIAAHLEHARMLRSSAGADG